MIAMFGILMCEFEICKAEGLLMTRDVSFCAT